MGAGQVSNERERRLRDLCVELGRRLRAGEAYRVEDCLEQHPHLVEDEESVVELLYTEYVVREELGEELNSGEWFARFPRWRHRLHRLFEFHRLLEVEESETAAFSSPTSLRGEEAASSEAQSREFPTLGAFELIEEVGRGGMGVVYKARQPALNRIVAVKVILADGEPNPRERERLRFEAEAAARLQHPNIVQVHGYDEQDGRPYLVLEYVEGRNLGAFIKQSERRVDWSATLIETLARAAEHAHQRGIVHRDLTPSNVLMTADGTPKITDFGLAKSLGQERSVTSSGVFQGTPRYMAPEQVAGRSREVGPAADVYALGVIFYELLTGAAPFKGATPLETMRMVMEEFPASPTRLRTDVPLDLATICLKCLERDPRRRYESAEALAEDLRRFQCGEPIRARRSSSAGRLLKWARRRPAEAALAALIVGGATAVLVGGFWWNAWLRRHGAMLEAALVREQHAATAASTALERADQQEKIVRRHWYASQVRLAQQALEAGQIELAQELLANERLEPGGAGLESFEWLHVHAASTRESTRLFGHSTGVYTLTLSPDGRRLASRDHAGGLLFHDIVSGRAWSASGEPLLTPSQAASGFYGGSGPPDLGGPVAVTLREAASRREWTAPYGHAKTLVELCGFNRTGSTLFLWDRSWSGGKTADQDQRIGSGAGARVSEASALVVSPDGGSFVMGDQAGRASIFDAATGRERTALECVEGRLHAMSFSRDGQRLAAGFGDGCSVIWDVATGRILRRFIDHPHLVVSVALSPDGAMLAAREGPEDVVLRDLVTGRQWAVRLDTPRWWFDMEFSPDGRSLALGGEGVHPRIYDVATGAERLRFPGEIGTTFNLAFTPSGRTLILGGDEGRIWLWRLEPTVVADSLDGHTSETWALAFSPDGRTLASGSDDTTIALWDVATRRRRAILQGHPATVSDLAFSPDGRVLAAVDLGNNVKLWDVEHGRELAALTGHVERVRAVAFSRDGRSLATTGTDKTVRLWDVAAQTCRAVLQCHADTVRALGFSPDGRFLASAGNDRRIVLHSLQGEPTRRTLTASGSVAALSFSPDGRRLAAAGEDQCVTIWDVDSGRLQGTLRGAAQRVLAVSFSPDGKSLASAGEDRAIHLWDPITGQERLTLRGHRAKINALAFSPDGRTLASGSHDGAIRLWYAPKDEPR